jgi:hypothetical protein
MLTQVAIVVTAYQRMGLRDEALFRALASVVKALPPEDFDAQVLTLLALLVQKYK